MRCGSRPRDGSPRSTTGPRSWRRRPRSPTRSSAGACRRARGRARGRPGCRRRRRGIARSGTGAVRQARSSKLNTRCRRVVRAYRDTTCGACAGGTFGRMPQVVEFPPIGQDARGALVALVRVCKETPAKGEPFRELRSRLRVAKLWDRDRPAVMLRFLGASGATVVPSIFMQAVAAANGDDEVAIAILDRMWHLNALLAKTIVELVAQRAYGKDEIYKHLASAAYRGVVPSRPALETWLQIAIGTGLLRTIGIAVVPGPRVDRYAALAADLDVAEFLAEDK